MNSKIEFIIPTHESPKYIMLMLYCLQCQTNDNWTAHVIADGDYKGYNDVKSHFESVEKIRFSMIDGPNKDWGHTPRNYGLKHLTQEWVVMTGQDNYYAPTFVEVFLGSANDQQVNFVYCDMIHNHFGRQYVKSTIKRGQIDIGNFMCRSKYASEMQLDVKDYGADFLFIEKYLNLSAPGKMAHIPAGLYVHN